jgi:hypothetical protein
MTDELGGASSSSENDGEEEKDDVSGPGSEERAVSGGF